MHAKAVPEQDAEIAPTIFANLGACRMKQHRWAEAIVACDSAVKLSPTYTKAIVRRSQAKARLRLHKEATADARQAIEAGACRYINVKPGRVGGVTVAKQIHDLAQAKGVPCWVGGMVGP